MKRLLMTGIRPGGETRYACRIHPNAESPFPPLLIHATLRELRQWIEHRHATPSGPRALSRPVLRLVT
ncbi:MAG: hypothetical protein HY423_13920 [Candidatus Lambdaproteobacteria bacterium]|nr:hypothetical protein [Candidatus Lambdaproteobacteria bacterium]